LTGLLPVTVIFSKPAIYSSLFMGQGSGGVLKSVLDNERIKYLVILSNTMEAVSIKFEEDFLHQLDRIMKKHRYSTKAEFIREAVRDKMHDLEKREYLMRAMKLYGTGKEKHGRISDKDLHIAREKAAKELAKEFNIG